MTKNSAKTNLLFEDFSTNAGFDIESCYPSEEDFTFVKKAKAEYTQKGYNAEAHYRPDVLSAVIINRNRIIRILVASILLGWNDMVQAMKAAFEKLDGTNAELKTIINEIIANRSRISGFDPEEKEEEPQQTQTQQTNSGLDIRIDTNNSPINFRRIILYDNRYSPAARRHYIVGKKDASGKYKIVIRGSDVGPSYDYKYYDTVFFDSDTQAETFINRAITDINTAMPLSSFTYKITSKGINMGSIQINDLSDCVLVNTICGPAYIYRDAKNCVESLQEKIVHLSNGDWQVQSEKGRNMGTYDTKKEAKKRLGQVEYFKHMNEEVSKDLETNVRNIVKDFLDEKNSRLSILEYDDGYDGFVEEFGEDENGHKDVIDFGVFTLNKLTDEEIEDGRPVITFLLSGGLNGSGDWIDYLKDISKLFKRFKEELGLHAIVYKLDTDIADDVWTAEVLLYIDRDEVKENLTEDLIVISPEESKQKIEELKAQIENCSDPKVRKSLLTLMNIYLFQTYKPSDDIHRGSTLTDDEWQKVADWHKEETKKPLEEELWPKEHNETTIEYFETDEVMKAKVRDWLAAEKPCEYQIENVPADLTWEEVIDAYKKGREPRGGLHLDTEPREYIWQRAGELYYLQTGEFLDADFERIYKEKRTDLQTPEEKVEGEEMLMATKPGVPEDEVAIEEPIEEDVEKHDHLNPKLFDNNHLKPEVRQKCMEIVDFFLKQLEEDEVKIDVKDIIFTGSNASYNYTKDSDIDLHIIADTSNFECPDNLYPKLYNAYKSLFNSKFDVSFYGIPVEIYVETGDDPLISNGIYSIKNDAWVQEPTETTIPEIDWNDFMKVYQPWEDEYKELVRDLDPETATDDKPIDDFITKVYELRHTGLANEGQYGFSNLIFKELRNRGHLQELKDLKNEIIANRLTLEALTEAANIDEKTRLIYRNKLAQIAHNQPIIQNNGLFHIYNVKADDADYIIRELQRLDLVEYVSKTTDKFDFSKINFDGMPSRYYTISGRIKI